MFNAINNLIEILHPKEKTRIFLFDLLHYLIKLDPYINDTYIKLIELSKEPDVVLTFTGLYNILKLKYPKEMSDFISYYQVKTYKDKLNKLSL